MPMLTVLTGTDGNGKPLLRCPICGATSDRAKFMVDASAGVAECHAHVKGGHSRPARGKLADFDPDKSPEPPKK